jgi:rhodanese-related sulfurtransferase
MAIKLISPEELKKLIDNNSSVQLVDIREKYELEVEGKSNAVHIPMGELVDKLAEIPERENIIFHCSSGQRSSNILNFMLMNGLYKDNYYSLKGGFKAWSEIN